MDPVLSAALRSWDLRPEVIITLALAGIIYTLGWWRLRKRSSSRSKRSGWHVGASWRPVAYWGGLLILGIALMSPIDVLGTQLFTMHMVQHVLIVMIVPPLLLLANPLPYFLWGLPDKGRLRVGRLFSRGSGFRRTLKKITGPGLVWMAFVAIYWGWHDPNAYSFALQNSLVHDIEHFSFLLISILYWWHVIGAGPRIHRPFSPAARIGYLIAAIPPSMLAGVVIAFATQPIYSYYEAMPRLWGLSVMDDQRIAGVIMWVLGSMMYIIAVLIIASRWLKREERKPALPQSAWASEEALTAPGLEK
jgi:cytochrome c oxidase assembly factor CtaG